MTYTFIGIDPGMSGAIAKIGAAIDAVPFKDLTEKDILNIIGGFIFPPEDSFTFIENVHSMPKQGVASSFKFGMNFGFLKGCVYGFGGRFELVSPQKWQKELGCMSHGDKNVTKAKAQQLFPTMKCTHAISDALLLAEYCKRIVTAREMDLRRE